MVDRIPVHWTMQTDPVPPSVAAVVVRGEYFTFQLAVFVPPGGSLVENITITFEGQLSALSPTCFNLGGIDPQGREFKTAVSVEADRVRSFWMGIQVPADMAPSTVVRGAIIFGAANGLENTTVPVMLTVSEAPVQTMEPEPAKMTRLRWLNSELYTQDYGLVPPYTAIERTGNTLSILNRKLHIGDAVGLTRGLPSQINVTRPASRHGTLAAKTVELLHSPITLELIDANGESMKISTAALASAVQFTTKGEGLVSWIANMSISGVEVTVSFALGMEGLMKGSISLRAANASSLISLSDVRVLVPMANQHGLSWMGLSERGSIYPESRPECHSVQDAKRDPALGPAALSGGGRYQ
jgi:hypothetical protein